MTPVNSHGLQLESALCSGTYKPPAGPQQMSELGGHAIRTSHSKFRSLIMGSHLESM